MRLLLAILIALLFAPAAQAAFCALCTPRNDPMPPRCAIARAVPPVACMICSA